MKKFKMIKAGEESIITEEEVIEIIGQEDFDYIQEELKDRSHTTYVQDDIEIFF